MKKLTLFSFSFLMACGGPGMDMPMQPGDSMPMGGAPMTEAPEMAPAQPAAPPPPMSPMMPAPAEPAPAEVTPTPAPKENHGGPCQRGDQCAGGICLDEVTACSQACDLEKPDSCRQVKGFCVPLETGDGACFGSIDLGRDTDEATISVGDAVTRTLDTLGDTDLFRVNLNRLGEIAFVVKPASGVDVALDGHNAIGEAMGVFDEAGLGELEAAVSTVESIDGWVYFAVRNAGKSTGSYTFTVQVVK